MILEGNKLKHAAVHYHRAGSEMSRALEQDQRFTLDATDRWCRDKARVKKWDLDVAACKERHLAKRYFTVENNGLLQPWDAEAIWANIPFSHIAPWVRRAWAAMDSGESGTIAMLMPGSRTEQPFWQHAIEPFRDREPRRLKSGRVWLTSHFLPDRTRFGHPGNRRALGVGSPPFGCVLLVWARTPQTSARAA